MDFKTIKRPWQKKSQTRHNPDPFYQSQEWKGIKRAFGQMSTIVNGQEMSNMLCIECFKQGKIVTKHTDDHIVRIKDGGSRTDFANLQPLCEHHHAVKSANEANQSRK